MRLDVRRAETIKDGAQPIGNRTRVKVVKNKMAPPFKQAEFDILYGEGISRESGIIDMAVETDVVTKSGSWYTYEGDQLGQGKEKARQFLKDNPEICAEIEHKVRARLGVGEDATADIAGAENFSSADARPADAASSAD